MSKMMPTDYDSYFEPKRSKRKSSPTKPRREHAPKPAMKIRSSGVQTPSIINNNCTDILSITPFDTNIKIEFTHMSIVSLNGRNMDYGKWKVRGNVPTFTALLKMLRNIMIWRR